MANIKSMKELEPNTMQLNLIETKMAAKHEGFERATYEARAAWDCNATVGHKSWSLKQLHGLYKLVMDVREELMNLAVEGQSFISLPAPDLSTDSQ